MTASEILVIILAVALAVFLLLAIILTILLIVIARKIKTVANTAERSVLHFEGIVATLQKAAAPAIISKFIVEQISRFAEHGKKKKDKED